MKTLQYQQEAIKQLVEKVIYQLNRSGSRRKIVFDAPTGAGKTVMACATLEAIVNELQNRGDSRYQECAFIWFAPRKLHIQSYDSLKKAFGESRKLRPIMFEELDASEGIRPGEILFVNWESVNKDNNVIARDSENSASIYEIARRTRDQLGLPIVVIIDEEHMFWSKTADKSAAVLDRINPVVELRISATPKTLHFDDYVKVQRLDVIESGMIKKEVILNPDIDVDVSNSISLNERLIKTALEKRNRISEEYKAIGVNINPLLLIQLPNDTKVAMTADDMAIAEQVKLYLKSMYDITEENGKLAVWLANEKSNLAGLEKPDNLAQVLLFKEAIALGWDCPRAAVLLIFRKLQSDQFTIQTVGRILRMPEQKHYPREILNYGYVYTDIAKDKIQIISADADYIVKNTITATRRANLVNVELPSVYADRPNILHNYLGSDFRKVLYAEAANFWRLEQNAGLFSIAELIAMCGDDEDFSTLPESDDSKVNENRRRVQNFLRLDVKTVNVEIPKDVHFQNEEQTINVEQVKFARTTSEIDRVFLAYISTKGGQFESRNGGRTDKIANYLLEMIADFFGIFDTDAKKIVLYHENKPKFDRLLDKALDSYAKKRNLYKQKVERSLKEYQWEVPEERVYDSDTNEIVPETEAHALDPYVQLINAGSQTERDFVAYLEDNKRYIDWWYKNGDKGKMHYAIAYKGEEGATPLFYPDFIIRMKTGLIYIFDTKTENSDIVAPEKHNALLAYIHENSTEAHPLSGGIIIHRPNRGGWLYSKHPIENTTDLDQWDMFDPKNA